MRFLRATRTLDPQHISQILRAHPYHLDSLLQLGEVAKMGGDVPLAADFVERALYCFECGAHTMFNVATGTCRLAYSHHPNRAVFIALFRHIGYVSNKGCWRTAFEVSKLLLSLNPDADPMGALLLIDYYALRASEHAYLQRLFAEWGVARRLDWLPNFAYSAALAEFSCALDTTDGRLGAATDTAAADRLLRQALVRFPRVLPLLADRCRATLHPRLLGHAIFQKPASPNRSEQCVRHLSVLYTERAHPLWRPAEVLEWAQRNALHILDNLPEYEPQLDAARQRCRTHFPGTPLNVQRHTVLSEIQAAIALLPPEVREQSVLSYDPLPPPGNPSPYDQRLEQEARPEYRGGAVEAFLRSLFPTFNGERQAAAQRAGEEAPAGLAGLAAEFQAGPVAEYLQDMVQGWNVAGLFRRGEGEEGELADGGPEADIDAELAAMLALEQAARREAPEE